MFLFPGRRFAMRTITFQILLSLTAIVAINSASVVGAIAQNSGHHGHRAGLSSHHGGHGASPSDPPVVAEYKTAHDRMMRAMDVPYTGDPDVDFRVHMIPHHAGAMDMARIAMRNAKDPWTRQLAESVIYEQQREITEMQGWLTRRGVRVPQSGQPYHVLTTEFVRTEPVNPGARNELAGKAWAPGLGIPGQE